MPSRFDDSDSDEELTVDAIRAARARRNGGAQAQTQVESQTNAVSRQALSGTQRALKQLEQTQQMAASTLEAVHDQVGPRAAGMLLTAAFLPAQLSPTLTVTVPFVLRTINWTASTTTWTRCALNPNLLTRPPASDLLPATSAAEPI